MPGNFQLDDVQALIAVLEAAIPGLSVSINWVGTVQASAKHVTSPTVEYTVDFQGHKIHTGNPVSLAALPFQLAGDIRSATLNPKDSQIQALLVQLENCPVT